MESADTISAGTGPSPRAKRSSMTAVFPDPVGPKRMHTGIACSPGIVALFFETEFDLLGKNLAGRQGHHLTVVIFDFGVLQHGKLVGSPGGGAGNLVHITVMFNEFFKGKYHNRTVYSF
jgi:hypothetical protein